MNKIYRLLFLLGLLGGSFEQVEATPAQVIIIRHGERPGDPALTNLTGQGQERSGALAFFFQVTPLVLDFGLPTAIYAFKPDGASHRGLETVIPLAQALGMPVHIPFNIPLVNDMANLILNDPRLDGKMVLICWSHVPIPDLILALGGPQIPMPPEDRYDLVYKLTYSESSPPHLCIGLQQLMYDDSDTLPLDLEPFQCP